MDKIQRYIVYVISPILLITVFFALMSNAGTASWLFIPIIGVSMLIIYMELFIMPHPSMKKEFVIGFAILVFGTTCIGVFGKNEIYHVFYLLEIFMLIRFGERKNVWWVLAVLAGMVGLIIKLRVSSGYDFLVGWIQVMALYSGALVAIIIIKYMIRLNEKLEATQLHLVEKNMDLSHAYDQLKRAYDDLEDYTIMKERTYMSREMHDTVGHTLTSSLVELELCKMLVKDDDEVKEKLEHVEGQVRKGLSDLRVTVRKLKEDLNWEEEIMALGERLSKYTDIKVRTHINSLKNMDIDTLRCIYRMIQESVTNGIKHGQATAFIIEVTLQAEWIFVEIMDNGKGATAFKQGFGLTAMTERVDALKGKIEFESHKDEGFTVKAYLPKIFAKE